MTDVAESRPAEPNNDTAGSDADSTPTSDEQTVWQRLFGIDTRALALVRIGAALVMLWDIAHLLPHAAA